MKKDIQIIRHALAAFITAFFVLSSLATAQTRTQWKSSFPKTNFDRSVINFDEVVTYGGPNSIPPIDEPIFARVADLNGIGALEPVVSVDINGDKRAYPIRVLLFHEIVNDVVGKVPIVVTYCAFCNSGIVFDRRVDGDILEFGNTGKYRHYGMIMYDKQSESWWQQFIGEAVVGDRLGQELTTFSTRMESLAKFRERVPDGLVLVPNDTSQYPYGRTQYSGYADHVSPQVTAARFPYDFPEGVNPMQRMVIVEDQAWSVDLLKRLERIETGDYVLTWEPGQNSVYHGRVIADGLDLGNVLVQKKTSNGLEDIRYEVSFAFTFAAFVPDGIWHL